MRFAKEHMNRRFCRASILLLVLAVGFTGEASIGCPSESSTLDIRLVTDEADAVLSILHKLNTGELVTDTDWNRLFATEGYVRLKKREAGVKRSFEDAEFREFVLSPELLASADMLEATLARWKSADMKAAATRALAYLPAGTAIRAKVYPVIKPKTNSFVFELQTDPAIFLYLNPMDSMLLEKEFFPVQRTFYKMQGQ